MEMIVGRIIRQRGYKGPCSSLNGRDSGLHRWKCRCGDVGDRLTDYPTAEKRFHGWMTQEASLGEKGGECA